MTYSTVNDLYWALFGIICGGLAVILVLGLALVALRARRFRDRRRTRQMRRFLVEAGRNARAAEDAYWFLLRGRDARIAQTIHDSNAVVRVLADVRQAKLEAV